MKFYHYSKCSTCRNAKKWLEQHQKTFEIIDLIENPPSAKELTDWIQKSARPIKDFLNRSGLQYRALNMKDRLKTLSDAQILDLLASDGRLIKRPLVIDNNRITIGFSEKEFLSTWSSLPTQ